jgi:hypothetical protein
VLPKIASIFLLTSIFNNSIHSSIAVFYSGRTFHENGKGRIEQMATKKKGGSKKKGGKKKK